MPLQPRVSGRQSGKVLPNGRGFRHAKDRVGEVGAVSDIADRLWSGAADRLDAERLAEARVLLLGFPPEHLAGLRENLRCGGVRATAAAPSVMQLRNVVEMGTAFSHVLVNFDAFDDVESGVDALVAFRTGAPGIIVVVCSALVGGDDLGSERALICDATLRLPVSAPRLRDGLVAASVNHDERGRGHGRARNQ